MRSRSHKAGIDAAYFIFALFLFSGNAASQSVNVSYPTPVLTNQVEGTIKARDIGDSRLTSYYYTFLANQGDVFINIVTKNLNGDIDLFLAEGLKPLTKIVVYADVADNETGRVVYFRKPEKVILRVEGRTPNDDPATFRIKFAGSFEASKDSPEDEPAVPQVTAANNTAIQVNSVGTIVAVIPKPEPSPKPAETVAENENSTEEPEAAAAEPAEKAVEKSSEKKVEVVVTDTTAAPEPKKKTVKAQPAARRSRRKPVRTAKARAEKASASTRRASEEDKPEPAADPLKSIFLVIEFKSGGRIERPMSEVLRMTVDKGVLTVVSRDGTVGRYSILDIVKTTIQ